PHVAIEAAIVAGAGVAAMLVAMRFDLYETFLRWTRGLERYNVDEAPFALFVLVVALALFAYRRWRELGAESKMRRELESAAAKAHLRLIDAVESIPASFMLFDARDRLVLANSKSAEFFPELAPHLRPGARFEDLARTSIVGGFAFDGAGREADWLETRLALHRCPGQVFEEGRSDGRFLQVLERKTADGGTVGICTDITQLKRHEAELREAQKMEAVGRLTGGIAHDFNNLLTIILGNLQMLEEFGSAAAGEDLLLEALAASRRGAELTERLLAFARRQPLRPRPIEVGRLVNGMAGLLGRTLGDPIAVETDVAADVWPATADPGQVENAILNLAINARDAMPGGGRLTIRCANEKVADGNDRGLAPGDYVMIAVADTGTGMTPEILERAFEPFFTTKSEGKGTGLGLSMVYGFARQSGGLAAIASAPGRGTTVRLYLPRSPVAAAARLRAPREALADVPDAATVLVVEDDDGVRRFAARALREQGLTVLEAGDGLQALGVLEREGPVDLLFTDVMMPGGMSGADLAAEARRRFPSLRVLFASGDPEHRLDEAGAIPDSLALLQKPYDAASLTRRVAEIVTADPES
ncbi:MAG: ATP-binding protein, partial [Alphaproteobacteria bacterium]